ncbi:hypothetical protein [Prevotella sp. P6B1]|uniref:hypothetical protein n=1 Tax=Prevotella sp. P6B1 TaxID=1410613 RepID=UPI0006900168|nr:hypothetical protein [Prevotella sp. P6B1]
MKRITLILCIVFISFAAFAKDLKKDITMVSYEQSWLDNEGTLALKNNTNEEIRNIVFLIKYLDMSGNELDYEEFSNKISIAPGMTKKVNIPAYEHERYYHYYKTKDEFGHTAFKIEFTLKGYNLPEEEITESEDSFSPYSDYKSRNAQRDSDDNFGAYFLIGLFILIIVIGISVGLYVVVALMAQKRHRNVVLWVLLSILATPLLMIIILLFIGDDESRIDNQNWRQDI